MKILATTHFEMDFLADAILVGLHESNYDIFELPVIGHIRGRADDNYILADGSKGYTGVPGHLQLNQLPDYAHTEEELWDTYKDFDLVVMTSYRRYSVAALYKIKEKMGKFPENLVLVDGEDHSVIERGMIMEWKPIVYFKRELLKETHNFRILSRSVEGTPVFPCPFAAFVRSYPEVNDQEKDLDLFLALGMTYDARQTLLARFLETAEEIEAEALICANNDNPLRESHSLGKYLHQMLGYQEYLTKQARSKISASMRGFGRDTLNFWEKMSFETLCLWCDPGIVIPYPPIPNKHVVEFTEDCSDIQRLIKYYLDPIHEEERLQISRAGKKWLHANHTAERRAAYLLDISRKIIGGEQIIPEEFEL